MRLRYLLQHPNFVVSAIKMTDDELITASECALEVHSDHTAGKDIGDDWVGYILALMLLRDCLGREMVRREMEPVGPPMLAIGWDTSNIYQCLATGPSRVIIPPWLLEWSEKEQKGQSK